MKKNFLWIILVFFLILIGVFFYYLQFGIKEPSLSKKEMLPKQDELTTPTPTSTPTPTPTPEVIPFDYEVITVSPQEAKVKGKKGEAVIPNNEKVKVFRGLPPNHQLTDFTSLKPGQKLRVERIPGVMLNVYILK